MQSLHGDSYQDFVEHNMDGDVEVPDNICPECGGVRFIVAQNEGFTPPDPDHIELEYQCENGCTQEPTDTRSVLL